VRGWLLDTNVVRNCANPNPFQSHQFHRGSAGEDVGLLPDVTLAKLHMHRAIGRRRSPDRPSFVVEETCGRCLLAESCVTEDVIVRWKTDGGLRARAWPYIRSA